MVHQSKYEKDLGSFLGDMKSDFMTQGIDRQGDELETIMLRVERNLREFNDPVLVAQMARCYSDPDLVP